MDTARLDSILAKHTAIPTFAELLATRASYVPTLDIGMAPDLLLVAAALVASGRDAYVTNRNGLRYFAKAHPENLPAVPEAPEPDDDAPGDDVPHEVKYVLYYEETCDGDEPPDCASDNDHEDMRDAMDEATKIARRERRDIRVCEEIFEQGECASSELVDVVKWRKA